MNCKYCGAEIPEESKFCPECGKSQTEEQPPVEQTAQPAPVEEAAEPTPIVEGVKLTPGKLALTIAAVVVVLAVLIALVVSGRNKPEQTVEEPTMQTIAPTEELTIPADGNPDDATCKGTYTVTDAEAEQSNAQVVATMGDVELTAGQLQVYYWMEVYSFLNQYGNYISYFGLDVEAPLDMQPCELADTPMTWQQFFVESAIDSWRCFQSLALEAQKNHFVLADDAQEYIAGLETQITTSAKNAGLETAEELVHSNVGMGATLADYISYITTYTVGFEYYQDRYGALSASDAEIAEYYQQNKDSFAESGVTEDSVCVDVRHVLVKPEGGTAGEDGTTTYSEDEWAACLAKAQEVLELYLGGEQTEENFAALAKEHSEDPGSQEAGGLYTNVSKGVMVQEFEDWCFDEARQVGDTGLVKTRYGYHVMYFCGSKLEWRTKAEGMVIDSKGAQLIPDAMDAHPATVNFSAIRLSLVNLA